MLTRAALDRRYANMEGWSGRQGPYQDAVKRYVDFEPKSVLDVGCALGDGLRDAQKRWPNAALGGIDLSLVAIQKAQERLGGGSFWSFDITKKKELVPNFDLVLCIHTLEHLSQHPLVVTKAVVWLRNLATQMLIIMVPYRLAIPHLDHRMLFGIKSFDGLQPTLVECMGENHIVAVWRKPNAGT